MINQSSIQGKRVLVVGLGRSGHAAASLARKLKLKVKLSEKDKSEELALKADELKSKGIEVELGGHTQGFIKDSELVILSPGVEDSALPVAWAESNNIPIIAEIEFAWRLCPAEVIAITGTNGKTTVTTLVGQVLKASNRRVHICGNIGNPFSKDLPLMREGDYVCLEASSFQLERIESFKPKISLILNFTPDHLDRYAGVDQYLQAKKRIFINQDKNDYLLLNFMDPGLKKIASEAKAKVIYFNTDLKDNPNFSAVSKVADILGIDKKITDQVLRNFKGIEHRMEYIGELKGVEFINDSKATNIDSTSWALKNITKPVILIAGGKDKGLAFEAIKGDLEDKVRGMVLIGQTKEKLKQLFSHLTEVKEADSLEEAVSFAFKMAEAGDCVLLSPMCASFDMFSDYQERGNVFKKTVKELIKNHA